MTRPRVLLADDQQAILETVSRQLVDEFEIVAAVSDGQAALDAILDLKPDAVVLDISMPRMTGFEVAGQLLGLPDAPRVVFLTVHEDEDFVDAARCLGGSGYVLKRNVCTHLIAALRNALHKQDGATSGH